MKKLKIEECTLKPRPNFRGCKTLDDVQAKLRAAHPDWFIYRGAAHVALHKDSRPGSPRLLLVVETEAK
jgi:hypothetical protein